MFNNRPSFFSQTPPVVLNLIIINVIFWLASITLPRFGIDLTDLLGLHYFASEKFHIYQLVTYLFMHDTHSITHLFFNMFGVWMFGRVLEQVWGSRKFLLYYMVAGVGAAIIQELCWMADFWNLSQGMSAAIAANSGDALVGVETELRQYFRFGDISTLSAVDIANMKQIILNLPVTVGASGALFGVLLAFGWLFPDVKMFLLFIPIPIPARIFVGLYAVAELFLGVANFSGDSVAHFAHLGGMIFGLILLLIWRKQGKLYN